MRKNCLFYNKVFDYFAESDRRNFLYKFVNRMIGCVLIITFWEKQVKILFCG